MPISLHAAIIPSFLQIVTAVQGLIDKAETYCAEHGHAHDSIMDACLADDMRPFAYQILSVATHSIGAIEGVRSGSFMPNMEPPPRSFAEQRALLAGTAECLHQITEEEMEGYMGKDVLFSIPGTSIELRFIAEQFLLSFAQPNFYFHATTAYDILRNKGVAIGKGNFLGSMRVKAPA